MAKKYIEKAKTQFKRYEMGWWLEQAIQREKNIDQYLSQKKAKKKRLKLRYSENYTQLDAR